MKKEKTKTKANSKSVKNDVQSACDSIFDLAFEIDGMTKEFEAYIKRSDELLAPDSVAEYYYYEEKLLHYMRYCIREFALLAEKSDRARLAAAKFTSKKGYDLSEYDGNQEFDDLTEDDLFIEAEKMRQIVSVGEICGNRIDDIATFLYDSMEDDYWYIENYKDAIRILLDYTNDANDYHELLCDSYYYERHEQMINDIFDDNVKNLCQFLLIEHKEEEPKI